jgi:hypothetical protein
LIASTGALPRSATLRASQMSLRTSQISLGRVSTRWPIQISMS